MADDKKKPVDPWAEFEAELEAQRSKPTQLGGFGKRAWENVSGIPEGILELLGTVNPANLVQDGAKKLGLPSGPDLPGSGAFGRTLDRIGAQGKKVLESQSPWETLGNTAGIATEALGIPAVRAGEEFAAGNTGAGLADALFSLAPAAKGFVGKGGLKMAQPVGKPPIARGGLPEEFGVHATTGPQVVTPPELLALQRKAAEFANSMPEWNAQHASGMADNIRSFYERTDAQPPQTGAVGELSSSKIGDAILRGQAGRVGHQLGKDLSAPRELGKPRLVKVPAAKNNPLVGPQNINSVLQNILSELTEGGAPLMQRTPQAVDLGQTRLLGKPSKVSRFGSARGTKYQRDYGTLRDRGLMPDQIQAAEAALEAEAKAASKVAKGVKGKDPKKRQAKKRDLEEQIEL